MQDTNQIDVSGDINAAKQQATVMVQQIAPQIIEKYKETTMGGNWFKKTKVSKDPSIQQHLNDFNYIKDCDPIAFEKHEKSKEYLKDNIQEGDIVITHHLHCYPLRQLQNLLVIHRVN